MFWKMQPNDPSDYLLTIRCILLVCFFVVVAHAAPAVVEGGPPVPANPLLEEHDNYFIPNHLYDLGKPEREHLEVCRDSLKGLSYRVFSAVGYNLANSILIQGPDGGLVIVDTTGSTASGAQVLDVFREALGPGYSHQKMPKLPIKAIVYTHNHIDHTGGVEGILSQADRPACPVEPLSQRGQDGSYIGRQNCVEILSQEKVVAAVINTNTVIGPILNARSGYMYGSFIGSNKINNGIGPETDEGTSSFHMPSRTFSQQLLLTAAGVNMKLVYVPSETEDELMIFLPDGMNLSYLPGGQHVAADRGVDGWGGSGLLLSAEVIQGPSFPNLYSLRGTGYRNPAQWFRSVDVLRTYDSWGMIPSHGVPLCGHENIELLLRNFRDAIQFTHDQGVRFMRQGLVPEELALQVTLPPYLLNNLDDLKTPVETVVVRDGDGKEHTEHADPKDYLRPFYGSVAQSVRELYFGYLGWYDADPVHLAPTPPQRKALLSTAMMGGAEKVLKAAAEAVERGGEQLESGKKKRDPSLLEKADASLQWAAELATQIVEAEFGASRKSQRVCGPLLQKFCLPQLGKPCASPAPSKASCDGSRNLCRAKEIKATAFLGLAEQPMNPNWRDWYISSAQELCGLFETSPATTSGLVSRFITEELPPGAWINAWTMSLKAEVTAPVGKDAQCPAVSTGGYPTGSGVHATLGFYFPTPGGEGSQGYSLRIRCAISEFAVLEGPPATWSKEIGTVVEISRQEWTKLLAQETKAIREKDPEVFWNAIGKLPLARQGQVDAEAFFRDYFDPPPVRLPPLTVPHIGHDPG